ncbi:MAG: hypothetical protein ACKVY0_07650 [Prosthecobacter sp.]|uniref:hypothetical protein n=1 Tax=Prosthecobacter sp. TaxID=1965333 RepID=UPI0039030324
MEEQLSANLFVRELARRHRVMLLGGLAVIAHGLERKTKDVDIWLEPLADAPTWVAEIAAILRQLQTGRFWSLQRNDVLFPDEAAADVTGASPE